MTPQLISIYALAAMFVVATLWPINMGVLAFVGAKMVASAWVKVPIGVSLGVIVLLLAASVGASWLFPPARAAEPGGEGQEKE